MKPNGENGTQIIGRCWKWWPGWTSILRPDAENGAPFKLLISDLMLETVLKMVPRSSFNVEARCWKWFLDLLVPGSRFNVAARCWKWCPGWASMSKPDACCLLSHLPFVPTYWPLPTYTFATAPPHLLKSNPNKVKGPQLCRNCWCPILWPPTLDDTVLLWSPYTVVPRFHDPPSVPNYVPQHRCTSIIKL